MCYHNQIQSYNSEESVSVQHQLGTLAINFPLEPVVQVKLPLYVCKQDVCHQKYLLSRKTVQLTRYTNGERPKCVTNTWAVAKARVTPK